MSSTKKEDPVEKKWKKLNYVLDKHFSLCYKSISINGSLLFMKG